MPATSLSSQLSWGSYLLAAGALVLVVSPTLAGTSAYSRSAADLRTLEGVTSVLNGLSPGVSVELWYSPTTSQGMISLSGHQVSYLDGNRSLSNLCRWSLPSMTLSPFRVYIARLQGERVELSPLG